MKSIDEIISDIIAAEGGYSNNPNDSGGETMYGITARVARQAGYNGAMRDLSIQKARQIYYDEYVIRPAFDSVLLLSPEIAAELVDTGVNMGTQKASEFLQICLNAFNKRGEVYPDLKIDGSIGKATVSALASYMANRKADAVPVMLKALNSLQCARYLELTSIQKNEDFVFGWIKNRVAL